MPELPDVEIFRRRIARKGLHRLIADVTLSRELVKEGSAQTIRRRLRRHQLETTRRHGKNVFVRISDDGWLHLHFGMTGDVGFFDDRKEKPRFTRMLVEFDDGGFMAFEDMRKLGRIGLIDDPERWVEERNLGPDALRSSLGIEELLAAIEGRSGTVKGTLMNQEVIAGLGNLYVDEVLFHAGVQPDRSIDDLSGAELGQVSRRIAQVLKMAIARKVDAERFPSSYMLPHRSKDDHCPKCGGPWTIIRISGRTTYYCERDQH